MRPRQKCEICGVGLSGDRTKYLRQRYVGRMICGVCATKERKDMLASKYAKIRAEFEATSVCAVCGKAIQWKDSYIRKPRSSWPRTCCPTCHGKYAKRNAVYTREDLVSKISAYIKERGVYTSYLEVIKGCHLKTTLLKKFNISVLALNKELLGASLSRFSSTDNVIKTPLVPALAKLCAEYKLDSCQTVQDAYKAAQNAHFNVPKKAEFTEKLAKLYISAEGRYVGIVEFMHATGAGYDTLVERYGIDMAALSVDCGFLHHKMSWYEAVAYKMLRDLLPGAEISREHSFDDCRSTKGWRLRFDFFLPGYNVLIEVDGEQHKQGDIRYTEELAKNDSFKEAFAREHGMLLLRIDTKPRATFEDRFQKLVLEVIKPIELLEPRPGNAEGNQQPSQKER